MPPPPKVTVTVDSDDEAKPLTTWQKLKQLSGLLAAIAALLTAAGGTFASLNNQSKQGKVQESVYNMLTQRFEEFAVDIAVLQTELKYTREQNKELRDDMYRLHSRHPTIKGKPKRVEIKSSEIRDKIINSASSSSSTAVMVMTDIDIEGIPAEIEYKGIARLPEFDNIQRVVDDSDFGDGDGVIEKHEIK